MKRELVTVLMTEEGERIELSGVHFLIDTQDISDNNVTDLAIVQQEDAPEIWLLEKPDWIINVLRYYKILELPHGAVVQCKVVPQEVCNGS